MPKKLQVELSVIDRATKQIDQINGKFARFSKSVNNSLNKAISLRNIALVAVFSGIARSSIAAADKVEIFRKQLQMVSKSAAEADIKLAAIREFGRTSPLETEDVVRSYVRLRAVGIDPTIKQLETLGGVSLLFGQKMEETLDSFIGLNKRSLRSLGIEIDRTGSKAIIQSGNIRKETTKDAASIRQALLDVWAERFPDAINKAGQTLSARLEVMKSNIWEFQAQLVQEFLPGLEAGVGMLSGSFEKMIQNIRIFKATVYTVVAAVRTAFNGLQIAVDGVIVFVIALGTTFHFVATSIWNALLAITEPVRIVGEAIGALAARFVQFFQGIAERNWEKVKAAGAGMFEDLAIIGTDSMERLRGEWATVTDEWTEGNTRINATTSLLAERTSKNMGDIANSMVAVKMAWDDVNKAGTKADLGGTGDMGPEAPADPKNKIKAEVAVLEEKLKANKMYSDLIIENMASEYDRKMLVSKEKEAEALAQAQRWLDAEIITRQRYEDMKTEIATRGTAERNNLTKSEAGSTVDYFLRMNAYVITIMRAATESTRMESRKRQAILYSAALMEAAAASVSAIKAVIDDKSIPNTYAKIAMAAVAVGAIWATAGVQIANIRDQSFAHGTMGSRRGIAMVGEQGPEMVNLPTGSKVYSNYQTRNMNIQDAPVTINIAGNADSQTVSDLRQWSRNYQEAKRRGYLGFAGA